MPQAVGVVQCVGFPGILACADAMVKSARVAIVHYDLAERGEFIVVIRGPNSEVQLAVPAGLAAIETTEGATLVNYYIVPNPPENVVGVLPIEYTSRSEPFRS